MSYVYHLRNIQYFLLVYKHQKIILIHNALNNIPLYNNEANNTQLASKSLCLFYLHRMSYRINKYSKTNLLILNSLDNLVSLLFFNEFIF